MVGRVVRSSREWWRMVWRVVEKVVRSGEESFGEWQGMVGSVVGCGTESSKNGSRESCKKSGRESCRKSGR